MVQKSFKLFSIVNKSLDWTHDDYYTLRNRTKLTRTGWPEGGAIVHKFRKVTRMFLINLYLN